MSLDPLQRLFLPLPFANASLEVVVLLQIPHRRPAVSVQIGLILRQQTSQQLVILVANFVIMNRYLVETPVGELIGIVHLVKSERRR